MTQPYTYLLKSKSTNKFYYGLRYAKNCNPSDFWVIYFTSSKHVKELIKIYGIGDFEFEIRKIFDNKEAAILWERKVIQRMKLIYREDFLNKGSWPSIGCYERTPEHRKKLSNLAKKSELGKSTQFKAGHSHSVTNKTKIKISETRKQKFESCELNFSGKNNPFYGKIHSESFKENQRKKLGKSIMIDGIKYDSIKYASECLNISRCIIYSRLNSDKFKDYYYV